MGINEANAQAVLHQERALSAVNSLRMATMDYQFKLQGLGQQEKFHADLTIESLGNRNDIQQQTNRHAEEMLKIRYQSELNKDEYGRLVRTNDSSEDAFDPFWHSGAFNLD